MSAALDTRIPRSALCTKLTFMMLLNIRLVGPITKTTPAKQIKTKQMLTQLTSRCSKNKRNKKKLTVNTGQVIFSGEIYYNTPLNSVDKIVGKTSFFLCIIYCVTNYISYVHCIHVVGISR